MGGAAWHEPADGPYLKGMAPKIPRRKDRAGPAEWAGDLLVGHRRSLIVVAVSLALVACVIVLIGKAVHYASLADRLTGANTAWFPLLLGGELVAYAGYTMTYRGTARVLDGPRLPLGLTIRVVVASFGAFVVATTAGGLAVDYWALRRAGVPRHMAVARVIALKTLEWAVLGAAVAAVAAVLLVVSRHSESRPAELAWAITVPLCYAFALWFSSPRRAERFTGWRRGPLSTVFADAIQAVVIVRHILSRPTANLESIGGAVLYWSGDMLCLWAGLRAFDVHLGVAALVIGYTTGYAATMLPLPAGGAGGVDAAMIYSLTLVGVALGPALLGVMAYRFFSFWLPIVPGLIAGASLPQVGERLPALARPGHDPAAAASAASLRGR